jgi:hypothetical protein
MEKFHSLSITGRYIYGYLCLRNLIEQRNLNPLPDSLEAVLKEFVESEALDNWQSAAEDFLPSYILDDEIDIGSFNQISKDTRNEMALYYLSQQAPFKEVVEALIWLGISNLYIGFESNITFPYIEEIILLLLKDGITLPDFKNVEACNVSQRGGWGDITKMSLFLN